MDGTLIEAWASHKSSERRTGANRPLRTGRKSIFMGRSGVTKRPNRLPIRMLGCYTNSKGSRSGVSYLGHALIGRIAMDCWSTMVTLADGTAERDAALLMASQIPGVKPVTLGGDKNYDIARASATPSRNEGHTARDTEQHEPAECRR